ncbi:Mor transcription activator family protein [Cupriavidus taiwanensis]|uniref:Mor transcription activator family protein n=1 Tax=Cupriavidus taiwanensis TaxID=164546 RepID=UPI00041CEE00|nr:Mor transcription activator family protein [Cupriavidus taiwanensis]SOZ12064.1 conserved protein of unknown function [Cupriavidus taiwanensis]
MDLSEVKNLLPAMIRAVVNAIGIPAAIKLVEQLGGSTFPVPMRKNAAGEIRYQVLADAVGDEAASQLVELLGGQEIYVPLCSAALRELRDRQIRSDFDLITREHSALHAVATLAIRYKMSDRQIWRILNQTDREADSGEQHCLF